MTASAEHGMADVGFVNERRFLFPGAQLYGSFQEMMIFREIPRDAILETPSTSSVSGGSLKSRGKREPLEAAHVLIANE